MTFEAHLDGWESRRLSTGRAVDAHEHATILSIGELFNRARLPVDTPTELSDLVRRHQNDPIGGLKALGPRMGVPPGTMALLLRAPLSASVVSALLPVPIGELSVALAVAMLFSQVRPACS